MSTIKSSTTTTTAYQVEADTTGALVIQTGATPTTAVTVAANQSVTFAQAANLPNTFGFKNRIINGAMVIDQRNAGASISVSGNTGNQFGVDRFLVQGTSAEGVFSAQQLSATPPTGFRNYVRIQTTTASASPASGSLYAMSQIIEGFNIADLGFGAAGASTVTFSFWIRSSLTGTFSGSLKNGNSFNRSYPFTYAISAANTWEYKTVTVAGDTTGTWQTGNLGGLIVYFDLGCGSSLLSTANSWQAGNLNGVTSSTRLISTLNATLDVTGVQLEKGSTATSFDYRPIGTELQLCQRYYEGQDGTSGNRFIISATSSTAAGIYFNWVNLSVQKRITPTVALVNQSYNSGNSGSSSNPSVTGFLAQYTVTLAGSYMFSGYTAYSEL